MRKISSILIFMTLIGLSMTFVAPVAAAGKYDEDIKRCFQARSIGQERSITDFVCPSGDNLKLGGREFVLTGVNLAYQVVVSKMFNELDAEVKAYFKELEKNRSKNAASWIKEMEIKFDSTKSENIYPRKYLEICASGATREILQSTNPGLSDELSRFSITTDSSIIEYISDSHSACRDLVNRKMLAFERMSMMIASQSIVKSFENDKTSFMNEVKGAYGRVLETWQKYSSRLTILVGKWDRFVTTPSIAP